MRLKSFSLRLFRFVFARFNYVGIASGTIWFCFSLTPSLLPHPWALQGFVGGLCFAAGYGIGVWLSWVGRKIFRKEPSRKVRRYAWYSLGLLCLIAVGSFLLLSFGWQNEVRLLVGEPPLDSSHRFGILMSSVCFALAIILTLRTIYWIISFLDRQLARWIPKRLSGVIAGSLVLVALYFVLNGVALKQFMIFANNASRDVNNSTPVGASQPTSNLRSGSAESLVSWDSLGKQGRRFTGMGPTTAQLQSFNGKTPTPPIRVYVGYDTVAGIKERAALAVKELERTHAFERSVLVVITPTGTGWIDPGTVDALEYVWNGDSAQVSIQYSYLPSWLSFLVDKENATTAGRELFNQVYAKWEQLPVDARPKLIAYGLSLGSFGAQAAFSGEDDLRNRTDGALFVGTPNDTFLWQDITDNRDATSPEWQPAYHQGKTIRFAAQSSDLTSPAGWNHPRVLYLQHASDPTVWWSPDLLFRRPDWLKEPRGDDVSRRIHWFPISTFIQLSVDQLVGGLAPDNHGHTYRTIPADAWATVAPSPDWDAEDTAKLRDLLTTYPAIGIPPRR